MVAKKGKKTGKKVKSLKPKPLSARKAKSVKGGSSVIGHEKWIQW